MLFQAQPHATSPSNQPLLKLIRHVFQGNIFSFSDGVKLHFVPPSEWGKYGLEMCTFSRMYFHGFERIHIHSLPPDEPKPLICLRFIDDIFAIWTDGTETLADFTTWLNSRHSNIKFTCSHSETAVYFLDTTVLLKDGQLESELFIKPTFALSYLHRLSSHPPHVFQSLPYGEFLWIRRNCSNLESFDRFSETIPEAFIQRGYERATLNRAREQARAIDRPTLLDSYANLQASSRTDANTSNTSSQDFYLILLHHDENTQIKQLLRKNWSILGTSDLTQSLYQSRLICGASRNPRLRDILVRSSLPLNPHFGKTGKSQNICTTPSCKYCHSLDISGHHITIDLDT